MSRSGARADPRHVAATGRLIIWPRRGLTNCFEVVWSILRIILGEILSRVETCLHYHLSLRVFHWRHVATVICRARPLLRPVPNGKMPKVMSHNHLAARLESSALMMSKLAIWQVPEPVSCTSHSRNLFPKDPL